MEPINACLHEARTLQKDGQMDAACARIEEEIHSREKDAALCAVLCTELAQLHMESGDMEKAQPLFERAMGLREQVDAAESYVQHPSQSPGDHDRLGFYSFCMFITCSNLGCKKRNAFKKLSDA